MAKKKTKIEFIGNNATSVTGSCIRMQTPDHMYLIECGLIQDGHTPLENYRANNKILQKIRASEIDAILVSHCHADHAAMIPALYEKGKCHASIVIPKGSRSILMEMWNDCAYINDRDVRFLNTKYDKNYEPFYTEKGIKNADQHLLEIDVGVLTNITEDLSIRYRNAGHIFLSCQIEIFLKTNGHVNKILYTGDLGNIATQSSRIFVDPFEPVLSANIVIGEATYASKSRDISSRTLTEDIEKIRTVIEQYCINGSGRVLIPTFSLDRMPYILWILFSIFGNDSSFNVPIIVDSPLANRLLDCYENILEGESLDRFTQMMEWKNIRRIITPEDSKSAISDNGPKIICASSGMLTAGRSVKWVQSILPRSKDCILFVGYAGEGTLAYKIKHHKDNKTININGKPYKNNAQIVDLKSFSSHMQRSDLLKYYKSIHCDRIYLVHSDKYAKEDFKADLQKEIGECLRTTRVISTTIGQKITL